VTILDAVPFRRVPDELQFAAHQAERPPQIRLSSPCRRYSPRNLIIASGHGSIFHPIRRIPFCSFPFSPI
jgi:hypothetical protein